eukprot:6069248-Amphidinium_carterae.1
MPMIQWELQATIGAILPEFMHHTMIGKWAIDEMRASPRASNQPIESSTRSSLQQLKYCWNPIT